MITLKNIVHVSLFLLMCIVYGMEQSNEQLALSTNDSSHLPITVNIEDDKTIVYSTQFNAEQLCYLGVLYNQYQIDQNNALAVPQKYVSKESFETLEKIGLLFSLHKTSLGEKIQKKELAKCFRRSKEPIKKFIDLLNAANFLDCPLVLELCLEHLSNRARVLIKKNKHDEALKLVEQVATQELSVALGNDLFKRSRLIKQLLMGCFTKGWVIPKKEAEHISCFHKSINYQTLQTKSVSLWCNNEMKNLERVSSADIGDLLISGSKVFIAAGRRIELYSLPEGNCMGFAPSKTFTVSLYYAQQQGLLFAVDSRFIDKYLILDDSSQQNNLIYQEGDISFQHIRASAFDDDKLLFYLWIEGNRGIYIYNVDESTVKKHFFEPRSEDMIRGLSLSSDKKTLFSISKPSEDKDLGEVCFWNIKNGRTFNVIKIKDYWSFSRPYMPQVFGSSPDNTLLVLASDKEVAIFNNKNGYHIKTLKGCTPPIAFSTNSKVLATKDSDNEAIVVHKLNNKEINKKLKHYRAEHIIMLEYCAQALQNKKPIRLSEETKVFFEQLPKDIKKYIRKRAHITIS